jgi:hypothetical protein
MEETRNKKAYIILVGKAERKGTLKRPRCKGGIILSLDLGK